MNCPPSESRPERDLPDGFLRWYAPLHRAFAARQRVLLAARRAALVRAHAGEPPHHLLPSAATLEPWRIEVPAWCADQRNQMTGPADDAELVVKMLNSGAPGVMLDLEDSMANRWDRLMLGVANIVRALRGELTYVDRKRERTVGIEPGPTVIWSRVRGLHLQQGGVMPDNEVTSASLFDLALIAYQVDPARLRHPLCIYIPKSESAEEARWWADVFAAVSTARGWPPDFIRCMALVESHPLAYQMEEFLHHLRGHIVGLNLGRWDYMASLIHFNLTDPRWVLPDRNTIPHDVAFFQRLRVLLVDICHRRGALAIGGMTALYPSREDPELNARALEVLERDKRNEAACFMDGAWTGHPDQNAIAVAQFPAPNQIARRAETVERYPDLRPAPDAVGDRTVAGTEAAARTAIRYRNGVLNGRGASLLDGYMEDLATDRIYRLMIAQRMRHRDVVPVRDAEGRPAPHDPAFVAAVFDRALAGVLDARTRGRDLGDEASLLAARLQSEAMIRHGWFDPV
jgi:malate synthase